MKDVSINTAAKTSETIDKVPEITFVKTRIIKMSAILIRITLSVVPIFFFILIFFNKVNKHL